MIGSSFEITTLEFFLLIGCLVALAAATLLAGLIVGYARGCRRQERIDPFAPVPLAERPVVALKESLLFQCLRADIAEGALEALEDRVEQLEALLARALYLKDRHWRSLKRLRAKIRKGTIVYNRPVVQLFGVA